MNRRLGRGMSLFLAAVLIVGGALVMAPISAEAAAGPTGYSLIPGGTGTAQLSTEQVHSAPTSVKLATITTNDRGMVRFEYAPGTLKLDDLTQLSYWEYVSARENPLDVFIDIWLDLNGDGVADASDYDGYLQAEPLYTVGAAPMNTWTQIDAMTLKWSTYVGPDDPYNAPTIADFQANTGVSAWTNNVDFGQLDVLRVDVRVGYGGTWANFTGYADDIRINDYVQGFATLSATTTDPLICTGESTTININLDAIANLYGYQFKVSYDQAKASAVGAFVNGLFDTTPPVSIPPAWNAVCSAGICSFAASHISTSAQQAVSGSGTLAQIVLTGVAPGTFSMAISDDTLSDIDGAVLPHNLDAALPLPITVCGNATVSGFITMQGRPGNIVDAGTVTMIEQAPTSFGPVAPVPFNPANGAYSIVVQYMPGGSSYQIVAEHGLYLDNQEVFNVTGNATKSTRLWGGDADNNDKVEIFDLSCIGGAFGQSPVTAVCGGPLPTPVGSPDINADGKVNIQDLSITGGNFDKCHAQPWDWVGGTAVTCP